MAKCAIVREVGTGFCTHANHLAAQRNMAMFLTSLGYEVDVLTMAIADAGTLANTKGYDFFVCPRLNADAESNPQPNNAGNFYDLARDGLATAPVFVCQLHWSTTVLGSGARKSSSPETAKVSLPNGSTWGFHAIWYATGEARTTEYVTATITSVLYKCAWRYVAANGTKYYVDTGNDGGYSWFPLLIQKAIENGDIPAPLRRKQITLDLDDVPSPLNTVAELTSLRDYLASKNLTALCGVHGAVSGYQGWSFVRDNQPPNGPFYIHDHQVGGDAQFFDWDLTDGGGAITKATLDTRYRAVQAALVAAGMKDRGLNNGGYRFSNQNALSISALQLMTPETHLAADPAGVTPIAGYGHRFVRVWPGMTTTDRANAASNYRFAGSCAEDVIFLGIRFVSYIGAIGLTATQTTDSDADLFARASMWTAFVTGMTKTKYIGLFIHNTDLYNGHDGGTGNGFDAYQDMVNFLLSLDRVFEIVPAGQFTA